MYSIHLYVTGCSQVTDFIPVVTHTPEGHIVAKDYNYYIM